METVETRGLLVHARRRTGRIHPADARHSRSARGGGQRRGTRFQPCSLSHRDGLPSKRRESSEAEGGRAGDGERRGRRAEHGAGATLEVEHNMGKEGGREGGRERASGGQSRSKGRESYESRNAEIPVISKPLLS